MVTTLLLLTLAYAAPLAAEAPFLCAGIEPTSLAPGAAKPTAATVRTRTGTLNALVVFARFADSGSSPELPAWSASFFDPDTPGTFSHFYDTMSLGRFRARGEIAPRYYTASRPASAYVGDRPDRQGRFGEFVAEILPQVDADIDFRRFDNDGPDGLPDSGDDDGVVDALFIILPEIPTNFLQGPATGIASLGLRPGYETVDVGASGVVRISSVQGTVTQARTFVEAVGTVCHEFGHLLGLPDLFNVTFVRSPERLTPEHDSAGIGRWGLMGWGALGWQGDDGPASLSAWSRDYLGWTQTRQARREHEQIGLADIGQAGDVFSIPLSTHERFLLEYRSPRSSFYDRNMPGEGLLIWHDIGASSLPNYGVDLETADGRWLEGGSPIGRTAAPAEGGDNLDFWAHDADYAAAHAGNLGDAGDPFDGVRYREFTPESNPASHSADGSRSFRLEDLRVGQDSLWAVVTTAPARLQLTSWRLQAVKRDSVLFPERETSLILRLSNVGGVALDSVRARVRSLHTLVTVADSIVEFGTVAVDRASGVPRSPFATLLTADFDTQQDFAIEISLSSAQTDGLDTMIVVPGIPSFTVHGRILDGDRRPVADTRVVFVSTPYTFISDEDGYYSGEVIPGDYYLNIRPPEPYLPEFRPISASEDVELDFALRAGVPFSGTVVDTAGQPVAGAWVNVSQVRGVTDAAGLFTLLALPGPGEIQIDPPREMMLPVLRQQILVDGSENRFVLTPGFRVDVAVHGADSVWVFLNGSAGSSVSRTGADGTSTHFLRPGIYFGGVADHSFGAVFRIESDTLMSFVLPPSELVVVSGRLIDHSRIPHLSQTLTFSPLSTHFGASTAVLEDDTFAETRLSRGRYAVHFRGETGSAPAQILDTIDVHGPLDIDFTVRDGEPFQGQLLDDSGTPLSGASIRLSSRASGVRAYATSDGNGIYQINTLPGEYNASVRMDSNMYQVDSVTLPGPAILHLPGGTVAGHLVNPPAAGARPALVALVDDPLTLFTTWYVQATRTSLLTSSVPASAAFVWNDGTFVLSGSRRYLIAFPSGVYGSYDTGTVIDLEKEAVSPSAVQVTWPTARRDTLYGKVSGQAASILQLYEAETGVIAQTNPSSVYILALPPGTYRGRVGNPDGPQFDLGTVVVDGNRRWDIDLADVATVVSASDASALPTGPELTQNYPNPFNADTVIRFRLPGDGDVRLKVFDILGRHVTTVVNERRGAGAHVVTWDGQDNDGRQVGSGVYLYRLQFGGRRLTKRLLLLR